jgi:FHS family L-fucose permease-like MFS transporter
MKKNNYFIPLVLIFSLFFIWAISSNLLPSMIRQLMETFKLSAFMGSLTEASYWMAYFIFPIPIAMFMKRYSYKAGIIMGLLIAAVGGLLFFPAAAIQQYWAYLAIFFIIATGMCFLETAANPYVTVLGDPNTAPRRLNLAQSFNGLGAFIAAMFLSKLVLRGKKYVQEAIPNDLREVIPADYPGGWDAYMQTKIDSMRLPYLILAGVLIIIAIVVIFSYLPKIKEGEHEEGDTKGEKLIDFSVFKRSHLRNGVIAQFFYNGGQTAINAMFLIYTCYYVGLKETEVVESLSPFSASTWFGIYMGAFLLGRWSGTFLMRKFRPQDMLVVYAVINVALCAVIVLVGGITGLYAMIGVSFFMSIMYPTQFSMALKDLGSKTKSGSAFLVMAIVGNVFLPPLTGRIMDKFPEIYHVAYIVPLICFIFCGYYGWKGHKVVD